MNGAADKIALEHALKVSIGGGGIIERVLEWEQFPGGRYIWNLFGVLSSMKHPPATSSNQQRAPSTRHVSARRTKPQARSGIRHSGHTNGTHQTASAHARRGRDHFRGMEWSWVRPTPSRWAACLIQFEGKRTTLGPQRRSKVSGKLQCHDNCAMGRGRKYTHTCIHTYIQFYAINESTNHAIYTNSTQARLNLT